MSEKPVAEMKEMETKAHIYQKYLLKQIEEFQRFSSGHCCLDGPKNRSSSSDETI